MKPEFFTASNQTEALEKAVEALSRSGLTAGDLNVDPSTGIVKVVPKVAREVGKKVLPTAEALESVKLLPVFTARLDYSDRKSVV